MESADKNEKISIPNIIGGFFVILLILTIFFSNIRYIVLDLPMYSLFKDSFYFPYYWSSVKFILGYIIFASAFIFTIIIMIKDFKARKRTEIGSIIYDLVILLIVFPAFLVLIHKETNTYTQNLYKDRLLAYNQITVSAEKLRYSSAGRRGGHIYRIGDFKLNKWQYKQLEKVKKQWGDEVDLRIYYMQNTEIVLKWDIINQNNNKDNDFQHLTSADINLKNIKVIAGNIIEDKVNYFCKNQCIDKKRSRIHLFKI